MMVFKFSCMCRCLCFVVGVTVILLRLLISSVCQTLLSFVVEPVSTTTVLLLCLGEWKLVKEKEENGEGNR